jgi:hypothetical protein
MSSGSSGRKHQPSLHDPKAVADLEPTAEWAARNKSQANDKAAVKDALHATETAKESKQPESNSKKKVSFSIGHLIIRSC